MCACVRVCLLMRICVCVYFWSVCVRMRACLFKMCVAVRICMCVCGGECTRVCLSCSWLWESVCVCVCACVRSRWSSWVGVADPGEKEPQSREIEYQSRWVFYIETRFRTRLIRDAEFSHHFPLFFPNRMAAIFSLSEEDTQFYCQFPLLGSYTKKTLVPSWSRLLLTCILASNRTKREAGIRCGL